MKFSLTEKIEKQTKIPHTKIIIIFIEGTYERFQNYSDGIMDGLVVDGKIKTLIKPQWGVDPFKSRLNGIIKSEDGQTTIRLKISPSWLIIGFNIIWYGLLLLWIFALDYHNIIESIKFLGLILIWALIPFSTTKIKLNRDRKRLENWLEIKINNIA